MTIARMVAAAAAVALLAAPVAAQELTGTLKKIKESGTIVIGHREASIPFAYIDQNQKPVGFTLDICARIVETIKKELSLPQLAVKYVPVNPQTRIPLIANGTVDMECGSTTNNLTRAQQVDFTHVTFVTGTKIMVKKGSGIKSADDLGGKVLAILQGTTNERWLKAHIEAKKLNVKILNVKDANEAMLALETDRADAYGHDDILLFGQRSKAKNPALWEVVGDYLSYDPYSIMVRRDDSAFRLVANKTISYMFRSGEFDQVYEKWFSPLGVPMSELLREGVRLQALPD